MEKIMLQGFEWYLNPEDNLWKTLSEKVTFFKDLGISDIWLPPASKGHRGLYDSGYGVYDLYDLGEFDQKGSVATKYGTKEEYLSLVNTLQENGIGVIVDIVLNHRIGADELESLRVKKVNPLKRFEIIEFRQVEAWTHFTFNGRNNNYSSFKWHKDHFTGIDYDASNKETGVFLLEGKEWDTHLSIEHQNYDYLMGVDVDFRNHEVMSEMKSYLDWYYDLIKFSGVRLDAIKHINGKSMTELIKHLQDGKEIYSVGEYWSADTQELVEYLKLSDFKTSLFDVALHHKFFDISYGRIKSIKNIFSGTLTEAYPDYSVPFVDNHDTQKGQSLESWIEPWFRHHANAFILLHDVKFPCVFYTDLNDEFIQKMIRLRSENRDGVFFENEISDEHVVFGFDGYNGYICSTNIGFHTTFKIKMDSTLVGRKYRDIIDGTNTGVVNSLGEIELKCNQQGVNIFVVDGGNDDKSIL